MAPRGFYNARLTGIGAGELNLRSSCWLPSPSPSPSRTSEMSRTVVWGSGLTAAMMLGCLNSAVLWSPDGRWVAYTIAVRSGAPELAPGWLFRSTSARGEGGESGEGMRRGPTASYRIWATRPETGESVLLE